MSPASKGGAPNQRLIFSPILWARVSPFSFSLLYKASEENYFLFLEKALKRPKALQYFLLQNIQNSIATPVRISGEFFASSRGLGSLLP